MTFETVKNYYENYDEEGRLFRDKAHLAEWLTTVRYLDRLIAPGSTVLDACAGTGRYSFYLAGKGHTVSALDLTPHNIGLIRSAPAAAQLTEIAECNVLELSRRYPPDSFDTVLCMGALYHLKTPDERRLAIAESVHVCKPGGLVVLAYLNKYAVIAAEVNKGLGNLTKLLELFGEETDFIFKASTPSEISSHAADCGLDILHNIGVDGVSFILSEKVNAASDDDFDKWMEYIYETCEEPSILGYSMHGLLIGRKKS